MILLQKILVVSVISSVVGGLYCYSGEKTHFKTDSYIEPDKDLTSVYCTSYCVKHFLVDATKKYKRIYTKYMCDETDSCDSNSCTKKLGYTRFTHSSRCCCNKTLCNDSLKSVEDFDSENRNWHDLFKGLVPGYKENKRQKTLLDNLSYCINTTVKYRQLLEDHQTVKEDLHSERNAKQLVENEKKNKEKELEEEKRIHSEEQSRLQALIDSLKIEKDDVVKTMMSEKKAADKWIAAAQEETEAWKEKHNSVKDRHYELAQSLNDERSQKEKDDAQREKETQKRDKELKLLKGRSVRAEKELEEARQKLRMQELEIIKFAKKSPVAAIDCQLRQSISINNTLVMEKSPADSSSLYLQPTKTTQESLIHWFKLHYKIIVLCLLSMLICILLLLVRVKLVNHKFYPNYSMNHLQTS